MNQQQALALLRNGDIKSWNRLRVGGLSPEEASAYAVGVLEHHIPWPSLNGAKLRNLKLDGINLTKVDLSRADLRSCSLVKAKLFDCNLIDCDLREAFLREADLSMAQIHGADLRETYLGGARLEMAGLCNAKLVGAHLMLADLRSASLKGADLRHADLREANLHRTDLRSADLREANLTRATLVETNLIGADLSGCTVYGIAAWDLRLSNTGQKDLLISREGQSEVRVDNLEVAQFVYLILNNERIRDVIDSIVSKAVLILGRFTPERKVVLNAVREKLRSNGYLPILFDFSKPTSRNITETVSTLAHLSRFVIADITDAKSIPQELQRIVPGLPSVPVQPLIESSQYEYAMFRDLLDYNSVLPPYRYSTLEELLQSLEEKVVGPAVEKGEEIQKRRQKLQEKMF